MEPWLPYPPDYRDIPAALWGAALAPTVAPA
jgi:hypothetical protein